MPSNLVKAQDEVASYDQRFTLWLTGWKNYPAPISLNWKSVKFERENRSTIPESQGIYAFFVVPQVANFRNHAYLMYIGETGQDSNNNLREKFSEYFAYKRNHKRPHIHRLLNKWDDYLYFYYAEIPHNTINLYELETMLLDTFQPPYNIRDFSAEISLRTRRGRL